MPKFGKASERQLATCHPDLQRILREAIEIFDFSVVEGHRGEAAQNAAVAKGASKVRWPNGKHNSNPSLAADCAPYPIDWGDPRDPNAERLAYERFVFMQGIFYAIARRLGIAVRQGIDWNRNLDMRDEKGLHDYPHIEIVLTPEGETSRE